MMNYRKISFILSLITLIFINGVSARQAREDSPQVAALKRSLEPVMALSLKQIVALVPEASGSTYIGCPNCRGGAQDLNVLTWEYGMGEKVQCRFCKMTFPNATFPNNKQKVIVAPSGTKQVYNYYEDPQGKAYYFEAHAWYERWKWVQKVAAQFTDLWEATKDPAYADRAAAILGRFAQVFPDYAVRFDYPSRPLQFFAADQKWPYEGLQPYRGSKWNWWGYSDIPLDMARLYDRLQKGYNWKRMDKVIAENTDQKIVNDLLLKGYDHAAANPEIYTNMSPGMYEDMIAVGKIVKDPRMVDDGLKRFNAFIEVGFFADGWWKEGATSYHNQTIGNLGNVVRAAELDPATMPFYKKATDVTKQAILPNGRKLPINDTWAYERTPGKGTDQTVSRLWPALGNALLGTGTGKDQIALNINWSGNYGHSHYDNGSIILYASGEELLSDIGYTHTKYRGATIHTAAHNTVVIDQKGQDAGTVEKPVTGRLKYYDDTDEHVKTIDLDASPAYEIAKTYRRRLVMVHAAPGRDYVVDLFDVEGGASHDWFLYGMCEEEGDLKFSIAADKKLSTLVPEWGGNQMPKNQYDVDLKGTRFHSYSFLRDIQSGNTNGYWTATWRYAQSGLRSHNLSQTGTEVYHFRSPSIRMAEEDNNKLDNYMRNGIMQRHNGGKSSFLSIHEPFTKDTWIDSVYRRGDEIIVKYKLNGKQVVDKINLSDSKVSVSSSTGWSYNSGTPRTGIVEGLDQAAGKWSLKLDQAVTKVAYVRLDFPGGDTHYYPVSAVEGRQLKLKDDPGFTMKNGQIKYHTFPHTKYEGILRYTVFEK
jgi:hypothetical protein